MLVITRLPGEATILRTADGTEVKLFILSVEGNKVRLGIEAPSSVKISRTEQFQVQPKQKRNHRAQSS